MLSERNGSFIVGKKICYMSERISVIMISRGSCLQKLSSSFLYRRCILVYINIFFSYSFQRFSQCLFTSASEIDAASGGNCRNANEIYVNICIHIERVYICYTHRLHTFMDCVVVCACNSKINKRNVM